MSSGYIPVPQLRRAEHTVDLPYHSSTIFNSLIDVPSYPTALDLITSSRVTAKDVHSLPKAAVLNVGYPSLGIAEEWPCLLKCDRATGVVEVKSKTGDAGAEGSSVLENWILKWKIEPAPIPTTTLGGGGKKTAKVSLQLDVKFKSIVYDQMFAVLPTNIAQRFISAFEPRFAETDEKERKERVEKMRAKAKAEAAKKAVAVRDTPPIKAGAQKESGSVKAAPKKLEVRSAKPAATANPATGAIK